MADTYTTRVAAELRAHLARRGKRQGVLAAELGVSDDWLSRRLRGYVELSVTDLDRICEALEVDTHEVLDNARAAEGSRRIDDQAVEA